MEAAGWKERKLQTSIHDKKHWNNNKEQPLEYNAEICIHKTGEQLTGTFSTSSHSDNDKRKLHITIFINPADMDQPIFIYYIQRFISFI